MVLRNKILFFTSLLAISTGLQAESVLYRPGASIPTLKSYEVDLSLSYFSKTAAYDVDGQEVDMESGDSFTMYNFDGVLRYAYGRQLGFRGGARWRKVDSKDGDYTNSNSGLESYFIGTKYVFQPVGKWRFAFDLEYRRTAYDNTVYDSGVAAARDDLVLGDDGDWFTFGGHATWLRSRSHYLEFFFGYTLTPDHLSPEMPYRLASVWPGTEWAFLLGLKGLYSTGSDEYSSDPAGKPQMSTGETAQFNSINREYMAPFVGLRKAFKNFTLGVEGSQVMSGKSTDKGYEVLLNLTWSSEGVAQEELKIKKFKEYDVEASVLKVSPRGKFVKIDRGIASDVEKGMRFDIYRTDYFGGNKLMASGVVYQAGADWAIVKVIKDYVAGGVKKGDTARGY